MVESAENGTGYDPQFPLFVGTDSVASHDYVAALVSYHKSLRMRQRLVDTDPQNISDQIDLSNTNRTIGALLYKTGDVQGARESVHKAFEIIRPIVQAHDDNLNALKELDNVLLTVASVDGEDLGGFVGLPSVALPYNLDALNVFRKLRERQPSNPRLPTQITYMDGLVSTDYLQSGSPEEAIRYARDAFQVLSRVDHANADATTRVLLTDQQSVAHSNMGNALLLSGRWREAASEFRSELSLRKEVVDPKNPDDLRALADGYINRGHAESLAGNPTAGLKLIRTGIDIVRSTSDAAARDRAILLGSAYVYEGEVLENLRDKRGALKSYKQAAAIFESPAIVVERPFNPLTAASCGKVAGALAKLGYSDQARETYNKALALLDLQTPSQPATLHVQYALVEIYAGLGRLELRQGAIPNSAKNNACNWYKKSMDVWLSMPVRSSVSPSGFKVTDYRTVAGQLAKCKQ